MRWCLRVKLAQNFMEFGKLLLSTNAKSIIEDSHKDAFWGAVRDKKDSNIMRGVNALGRLLMELRQQYLENPFSWKLVYVEPLKIPNFKLLGEHIGVVDEREKFINIIAKQYGLKASYSIYQNTINETIPYNKQTEIAVFKESDVKPLVEMENKINWKEKEKKATTSKSKKSKKVENKPTLFAQT